MRALLIGEDRTAGHAIALMLKTGGIGVDRSDSEREGVELLMRHDFDIVLLDVATRGAEACTQLERLREAARRIPVLALRARQSGQAGGCSAEDVLERPFGRQELFARMHSLLPRLRSPR